MLSRMYKFIEQFCFDDVCVTGNSQPSPRVSLTGAAGDKANAAAGAHIATSGGGGLTANCAAQQSTAAAAAALDSRKGSNGSAANHDHRNSNSSSNHSNAALRVRQKQSYLITS